ncbi:hypothetical protein HAX54_040747, partial [Datura stramonium]|nr:hypothetical protein [Datura stramonium]
TDLRGSVQETKPIFELNRSSLLPHGGGRNRRKLLFVWWSALIECGGGDLVGLAGEKGCWSMWCLDGVNGGDERDEERRKREGKEDGSGSSGCLWITVVRRLKTRERGEVRLCMGFPMRKVEIAEGPGKEMRGTESIGGSGSEEGNVRRCGGVKNESLLGFGGYYDNNRK